jgi:hypothetical protein
MKCVMVETGEGTTKVRIPTIFRIGNTSNGSIWCLHSSIGQEYGEVLVGQMEQIWALAGSPPRFSITATKCYLPKRKYVSGRRKLYVALVELGNSLGPGVESIPRRTATDATMTKHLSISTRSQIMQTTSLTSSPKMIRQHQKAKRWLYRVQTIMPG